MQDDHRGLIDGEPARATFEGVVAEAGDRLPVRYVKWAIAAAALIVVALVGANLFPTSGGLAESGAIASSSPAAAATHRPVPIAIELEPAWASGWRIGLTMPADWWSTDFGTTVYKEDAGPGRQNAPTLTVHRVARVATDICDPTGALVEVGPTAEDLTTALVNQAGPQRHLAGRTVGSALDDD